MLPDGEHPERETEARPGTRASSTSRSVPPPAIATTGYRQSRSAMGGVAPMSTSRMIPEPYGAKAASSLGI